MTGGVNSALGKLQFNEDLIPLIDQNDFDLITGVHSVIVIVIVNSKLLKRRTKAKRRAPAYSRALRQIRGVFQRIVRGKLRSGCQKVRGGRLGVKAGVV